GTVSAVVLHQQLQHHGTHQYRGLALAHTLTEVFLEIGAVEIDVVRARQTEGAQAVIIARLAVPEIDAHGFDLAEYARHFMDHPPGDRHVDDTVGQLGHVLEQELRRIPFRSGVHHRQVMVDAAADAAAVVEDPALFTDHHLQSGFQCRDRGHGARHPATDHQHIGIQPDEFADFGFCDSVHIAPQA